MSVCKVDHPNPALGLNSRTLYRQEKFCSRFDGVPAGSKKNIAFTSASDLLSDALRELGAASQGRFVTVAWAHVNGEPIEPIGFLVRQANAIAFTPLNPGNEDAEFFRQQHPSFNNLRHELDRRNRETPDELRAQRQWLTVPLTAAEASDPATSSALVRRATTILGHTLFGLRVSMTDLYEAAV